MSEEKENEEGVCQAEMWAYFTKDGSLLPSTIRQRRGDCDSALRKTGVKYRGKKFEECINKKVRIYWD